MKFVEFTEYSIFDMHNNHIDDTYNYGNDFAIVFREADIKIVKTMYNPFRYSIHTMNIINNKRHDYVQKGTDMFIDVYDY